MIKACIFDLDGTLLDTLSTIGGYVNEALATEGIPPFPPERYKYFVGNGARTLVRRALEAASAWSEEREARVFPFYTRLYDSAPNAGTKPYEGIMEMLSALKAKGVTVAVLSNKPDFATRSVVASFFGDRVAIAHGGREGVPLKPAPDGALALLEELGVTAEECLYIGDTGVDMDTARAAGLFGIGVSWGFREREELVAHGAKAIIDHPASLLDYVK